MTSPLPSCYSIIVSQTSIFDETLNAASIINIIETVSVPLKLKLEFPYHVITFWNTRELKSATDYHLRFEYWNTEGKLLKTSKSLNMRFDVQPLNKVRLVTIQFPDVSGYYHLRVSIKDKNETDSGWVLQDPRWELQVGDVSEEALKSKPKPDKK